MNTDRELLELAAKAAGIEGFYSDAVVFYFIRHKDGKWHPSGGVQIKEVDNNNTPGNTGRGTDIVKNVWNPLADDGDALRP